MSTYSATDHAKIVKEKHAYTPSGVKVSQVAVGNALDTDTSGFTGRPQFSQKSTLPFRKRTYSALEGRFLSRDPVKYLSGLNMYHGYFSIKSVDPYGLDSFDGINGCVLSQLQPNIVLGNTDGKSPEGCGQYAFKKLLFANTVVPWTGGLGVTIMMAPINGLTDSIRQKIGAALLEQLLTKLAKGEIDQEEFLKQLEDAIGDALDGEEWELIKEIAKRVQELVIKNAKGNCRMGEATTTYKDAGGGSESITCTIVVCADIDYHFFSADVVKGWTYSAQCKYSCTRGGNAGCCCGSSGSFSIDLSGSGAGPGCTVDKSKNQIRWPITSKPVGF